MNQNFSLVKRLLTRDSLRSLNITQNRVTDDGQKLLNLLHYYKGKARDAIEVCVLLSLEVAYKRAKDIMRGPYGQEHVVAKSLIEGSLKGLKSVPVKWDALTRLLLKILKCEVALTRMNCLGDLKSLQTTEQIVRALPNRIRRLWARSVDDMLS